MLTEETLGFQEGRKSNGMGKTKGEQTTLLEFCKNFER